jgi:hypothetical protein
VVRLGFDDNGDLASIVEVQHLKPNTAGETPEYFIRAMAIAIAHRGQGGVVADEAMTDALRTLARRVAGNDHRTFIVSGRIHRANTASQMMAARQGMTPHTAATGTDPYSRWAASVDIA